MSYVNVLPNPAHRGGGLAPDWRAATGRASDPEMCWRELVQMAMDGIYPCEARLETLLDRIEGDP